MKKFARFVLRTSKGIYDILATYLMLWVVPFALASLLLNLAFGTIVSLLEFETAEQLWQRVAQTIPLSTVWLRLAVFVPMHVLLFRVTRKPIAKVWPRVEAVFDELVEAFEYMTRRILPVRVAGEWLFTLVVTAVLIPFVVQPTLVPRDMALSSWVERAANLVDGSASAALGDSVVGLYRRVFANPVVVEGLRPEDQQVFDEVQDDSSVGPITPPMPNGTQPLMDRWDPYIEKIADNDPAMFAFIKAFMWVESGGRQYAVSHTGCAGLMQFCVGTARSQPFRDVFGTGAVYRCDCANKQCRTPRDVQRDMESGDPALLTKHASNFPCELTDARFDPNKIIAAGGLYIDNLRQAVGGNIYLMYIGYNSGPSIAKKVYAAVGRKPDATLAEIEVHLATAMKPHYGNGSEARARSLIRTHLPKLKGAYDKYYTVPKD